MGWTPGVPQVRRMRLETMQRSANCGGRYRSVSPAITHNLSKTMSETRYDVVYAEHHVYVEPHFCREWDDDGGCYGTNPDHGLSWTEARTEVAEYYEKLAAEWRDKKESDL